MGATAEVVAAMAAVAAAMVAAVAAAVVVARLLISVLETGTAPSATLTALPANPTASDAKHPSRARHASMRGVERGRRVQPPATCTSIAVQRHLSASWIGLGHST